MSVCLAHLIKTNPGHILKCLPMLAFFWRADAKDAFLVIFVYAAFFLSPGGLSLWGRSAARQLGSGDLGLLEIRLTERVGFHTWRKKEKKGRTTSRTTEPTHHTGSWDDLRVTC